MMMKHLFALAFALLLLFTAAAAEVLAIPGTDLTLDVDSLEPYEMTADDIEDGMVVLLGNDDDSLELCIYAYKVDGVTTDDLEAIALDDDGAALIDSEYITINGLKVFCMEEEYDGEPYDSYMLMDNGVYVQITFSYTTKAAARQAVQIINTLCGPAASSFPAGAQQIPGTGFTMDLTSTYLLDAADLDDDEAVLWFANDDDTLDAIVWVFDADGATLAEYYDILLAEDAYTNSGFTNINGADAIYLVSNEDADTLIEYFLQDANNIVQLSFLCSTPDAAQLSGEIMNTLRQ